MVDPEEREAQPLLDDAEPLARSPEGAHAENAPVPLARRPDLAYAMANLLSLCTACHARREAQERADRT